MRSNDREPAGGVCERSLGCDLEHGVDLCLRPLEVERDRARLLGRADEERPPNLLGVRP